MGFEPTTTIVAIYLENDNLNLHQLKDYQGRLYHTV